jgi:flagellar hook-associated protein 3 FlgL
MLAQNSLWDINNNLRRLDKAQQKMTTQSKIQLPSDDPIVATRALKYRNYVSAMEQYQRNADDATSWMEVSESALGQLNEVIQRVRELTVQAANDTNGDEDRQKILSEVRSLKDNMIEIMNTSYAGRYVFGGFNTDQPPYKIESTPAGDKVLFKGQYVSLGGPMDSGQADDELIDYCQLHASEQYQETVKQKMQYNIGFGSRISVNAEGQDIVGQDLGTNLFDVMDKLLLGLNGHDQYKVAEISGDPPDVTVQTKDLNLSGLLDELDGASNRMLTVRADLGARMNYINKAKDKIDGDYNTFLMLMSQNEDIDIAQISIEAKSAEYTYNASLSVGMKAITQSLIDYLK